MVDEAHMARALALAAGPSGGHRAQPLGGLRGGGRPDGRPVTFEGATGPARRVPTPRSGPSPGPAAQAGAPTLYTTLEPCAHHRPHAARASTPSLAAGVARVVVGVLDPDPQVPGAGVAALRAGRDRGRRSGSAPTRSPSSSPRT